MEINPDDYTDKIGHLSVGESIKINHLGCSESNSMKVTEQVEGTLFYCFKCCSTAFKSSFNSPRERLRRQTIFEETMRIKADVSYDLPADSSQTLPSDALVWLGTGGWTLEMMRQYRIQWSEKLSRVILPVSPIGYTARAVSKWQNPKYLEKAPRNAYWVSSVQHKDLTSCVICEDILSAGRCGEFMQSYSILGTSISTTTLSMLSKYKRVYIWLDPDRGGISGVKSMYRRLCLVCEEVIVVHSKSDPKCLTDNDIKELLCKST